MKMINPNFYQNSTENLLGAEDESLRSVPARMFAKVKYKVFIDNLIVELFENNFRVLKAFLHDEKGSICSAFETNLDENQHFVEWKGLNDLPYGIYTLVLNDGDHEMKTQMIKRI